VVIRKELRIDIIPIVRNCFAGYVLILICHVLSGMENEKFICRIVDLFASPSGIKLS
jgi:hypothetical protein